MKVTHIITILLSFVFSTCFSQVKNDFKGKEFWLSFMQNNDPSISLYQQINLIVALSAETATPVKVSIPGQNWQTTILVPADSIIEVVIPNHISINASWNSIQSNGVFIQSEKVISVTALSHMNGSTDATNVLPINRIGDKYYISSWPPYSPSIPTQWAPGSFVIVATEDGTEIEITPTAQLLTGQNTNNTFNITLNKGETYANGSRHDITGTKIKGAVSNGDCKPFVVFSGALIAEVPLDSYHWDHLWNQLYPMSMAGKKFHLAPIEYAGGYSCNVIATENGTTIQLNNGSGILLNEGDNHIYNSGNENLVITADKNIHVAQFLWGHTYTSNDTGDPSMVMIGPDSSGIQSVRFETFDTPIIDTHFVNLIIGTPFTSSIKLDDSFIPSSEFQPFEYDSTMSYASVTITSGQHELTSNFPFSGYMIGITSEQNAESYFYSLGSQEKIPSQIFTNVICSSGPVELISSNSLTNVWWNMTSNQTDTLIVNDTLIISPNVESGVYISNGIDQFGCPIKEHFLVENPIIPNFNISPIADTLCKFEKIKLSTTINSDTYSYNWHPEDLFDNPHSSTPTFTALGSGWIYADLISEQGCSYTTDSLYIYVNSGNDLFIDHISAESQLLCNGDSTQLSINVRKILAFDNFNDSISSNIWENITGAILADSCGLGEENSLYFYDSVSRFAETYPFDLSNMGQISFTLKVGSSIAPCDDAEEGDDILLQYSIDNGLSWVTFKVLYEYYYSISNTVIEFLPIIAQTPSTKIRIIQANFDNINLDTWEIDNFLISIDDASATVNWTPNYKISSTNDYSPIVYPDSSVYYINELVNGSCILKDSILIKADSFNASIQGDTTYCSYDNKQLTVNYSDSNDYQSIWSSSLGDSNLFDEMLESEYKVTPSPFNQFIFHTSLSKEGCLAKDTIFIPGVNSHFEHYIDTAMCLGDSVLLYGLDKSYITDDFNNTTVNDSLWLDIVDGVLTNTGGVLYGNALRFGGVGPVYRKAETRDFNTSRGGKISYYISYGSIDHRIKGGYSGGGDFVKLYYSIDQGTTWTLFSSAPNNSPDGNLRTGYVKHEVNIPSYAYSNHTRFKWEFHSLSPTLNYKPFSLENVQLELNVSSMIYSWESPLNTQLSTDDSIWVSPTSSTMYYIVREDTNGYCIAVDSIFIRVGTNFTSGLEDFDICGVETLDLTATGLPSGSSYDFIWYSNTNMTSTDSVFTINVNEPYEEIVVEISSSEGCTIIDTFTINPIFIWHLPTIVTDTVLCQGSNVIQLEAIMMYIRAYHDFDGGGISNSSLWDDIQGAINSSTCGSVTGLSKTFRWGGLRSVSTKTLPWYTNVNALSFSFKYGDNSGCDKPELGEEVIFEYSSDAGATWIPLDTLEIENYLIFKDVFIHLPPGISTLNSKFRWIQPGTYITDEDVWMIDNFRLLNVSDLNLHYKWFENGIPFGSDTANIQVSPSSSTTFTVEIQDSLGNCTWVDSINVFVSDINAYAGNDTTLCFSENYVLQGNTNATWPYTVDWNNNANLNSNSILNPTVLSDSTMTYVLSINKNGCIVSDSMEIILNTTPDVNLSVSNGIITVSEINGIYQWVDCMDNFNDISNETNQSFTPNSSGSYAVIVSNSECQDTSICLLMNLTSVTENDFGEGFDVYPNPTDEFVLIDLGNNYQSITATLTDLKGKIIYSKSFNEVQLIDLEIKAAAGVYLLTIKSGEKQTIVRILKK